MEQRLLEFKGEVYEMHRFSEEMQELHERNIKLIGEYSDLLKMCLGVTDAEIKGKTLVGPVRLCRNIKSQAKLMKMRLESMDKMAKSVKESIPQSDIELMESSVDVLKSTLKKVEEVSPEIGDILERLDKPACVLELGLERVQGLGFIQFFFFLLIVYFMWPP